MASTKISSLEELHAFLYRALQLEHATIPPYLTALYSIKPGTNPDASQILRVIAVEEMLHLTIAANLMNAVGGKVDLTQYGFSPDYPAYLPDGETDFQVGLAPFSPDALQTFLKIERPKMASSDSQKLLRNAHSPQAFVLGTHPDPAFRFYSIGEFYAAIEQGLKDLEAAAKAKGGTIFTGDPKFQVGPDYFYSGGGKLWPIHTLDDACRAIELVIEQGEGVTDKIHGEGGEIAHYYRFEQLSLQRYYQPDDKVPGEPTGPRFQIDWDAIYPVQIDLKLDQIPAGSALQQTAAAFNDKYRGFLDLLTQAFSGQPQLLLEAVPRMFEFRNLIWELVRNPLPGTDRYAGPTFEISQSTLPAEAAHAAQ